MTDRELLERAARAAGLGDVWYLDGSDTPYVGKRYAIGEKIEYRIFNPLIDDGDALRLAVKLDLLPSEWFWRERSIDYAMAAFSGDRQDPYAATRRAIVRAAAALAD